MEKSKFLARLVLASVAAAGLFNTALAQTDVPNNTARIQAVSEDRALVEAEIKRAESRKKLEEVKGGGFAQNTNVPSSTGRPAAAAGGSNTVSRIEADQELAGMPTVAYVEGRKGDLEAVLTFRGGAKQRVRVGDKVFGATVQKIALNEVSLSDAVNKSTVRLQFANPTTQGQMPGQMPYTSPVGGQPVPIVPIPGGMR